MNKDLYLIEIQSEDIMLSFITDSIIYDVNVLYKEMGKSNSYRIGTDDIDSISVKRLTTNDIKFMGVKYLHE